jgi:hypothetical protein
VEEFFRDAKSVRNGLALRHTQLTRADRFVLVPVLAYLLLTGLGLVAMATHQPGEWSSRNRGTPCSAALVGRAMTGRFTLSPAAAVAAILTTTIAAGQNWG